MSAVLNDMCHRCVDRHEQESEPIEWEVCAVHKFVYLSEFQAANRQLCRAIPQEFPLLLCCQLATTMLVTYICNWYHTTRGGSALGTVPRAVRSWRRDHGLGHHHFGSLVDRVADRRHFSIPRRQCPRLRNRGSTRAQVREIVSVRECARLRELSATT